MAGTCGRFTTVNTLTRVRHIGLIATTAVMVAGSALVAVPTQAAEAGIQIGDCVMVDDAWSGTSTFTIVDCAVTHNGEVYDIVAYPVNAGAPSTLSEDEISSIEDECSREAFDAWLGSDATLPLRIWRFFISVPSDAAWEAGDRDVACRSMRPTSRNEALSYTGAIPALLVSTPLQGWLNCMMKAPKSGGKNESANCTPKSAWLLLGGVRVKGKITANYPKDLQSAADKACGSLVKRFGKKGTKGLAALLPKDWVDPSFIFTECFIPLSAWNGKAS